MQVITSSWYRFGSISFVAALSVLCFKCAPFYWPFALLGFLGYACISLLKKTGLILSLTALLAVVCYTFPSYLEKMWLSLFLLTLSFSWILIYFQKEQTSQLLRVKEESLDSLNLEIVSLKQQLARVQGQYKTSQDEKNHLETLYSHSVSSLQASIRSVQQSESEKEALSTALKQAQMECQKAQSQLYADTSLESSTEELLKFEQLEHQYKILKNHFEEKSGALDLARKELFKIEGALHVLLQQTEEEKLNAPNEIRLLTRELIQLENQCNALENQIESLQDLTSLLIPFARTRLQ